MLQTAPVLKKGKTWQCSKCADIQYTTHAFCRLSLCKETYNVFKIYFSIL